MSGLSALQSKLRTLKIKTIERVKGKRVSVVHYPFGADTSTFVLPENANEGVLLVPALCKTQSEWEVLYGG